MRRAGGGLRELEQLRRVRNVVRLGHVSASSPQIVLQQGSSRPSCHLNCIRGARMSDNPRERSSPKTHHSQLVTRVGLTWAGALMGFLEFTGNDREEEHSLPADRHATPRSITCAWSWLASDEMGARAPDYESGSTASGSTFCVAWARPRTARPPRAQSLPTALFPRARQAEADRDTGHATRTSEDVRGAASAAEVRRCRPWYVRCRSILCSFPLRLGARPNCAPNHAVAAHRGGRGGVENGLYRRRPTGQQGRER